MGAALSSQSQHEGNMSTTLEDLVTCVVCKTSCVSSPSCALKLLPCFYSMCVRCLSPFAHSNSDSLPCIMGCNKKHSIPNSNIQELHDNYIANKMKYILPLLEILHDNVNTQNCLACEAEGLKTPSSTCCLQCQSFNCRKHGKIHMAATNHRVISREEICTDSMTPKVLFSKIEKCDDSDVHEDPKPYEHFCAQCQVMTCGNCLTYKHEGHEKVPLKKVTDKFSDELKEMVPGVKTAIAKKSEKLEALKVDLSRVTQKRDTTAKEMKAFGEEVKKMVDQIVRQKQESLKLKAKREEEVMQEQSREITQEKKLLEVAAKHADMLLEHGSCANIMQNHNVFKENLEECLEKADENDTFQAKTNSFCSEPLFKVQRSLIKMFHGKELQSTEIIASLNKGAMFYGSYASIAVDDDVGVFIVAGVQTMNVIGMDGELKSRIFCDGLVESGAVAVHGRLIYVIDKERMELVAFDIDGSRKGVIELPSIKRDHCNEFGLAVNPENGDFYVSYGTTGVIYKCSAKEAKVEQFISITTKEYISFPLHLCVIPNKGLIVSYNWRPKVDMYDFEGTLLWEYKYDRVYDPYNEVPSYHGGVCADHMGNIFVADVFKMRITYLSADGKVIKYIPTDIWPWALAMKNDIMVVLGRYNMAGQILKCNYI